MNVIRVLDPGLQTTVQDRGRLGWEHLGVARGGALDDVAMAWVNRVAGNEDDAAVLESLLLGITVSPLQDAWLATAGAEEVTVNGRRLQPWSGFRVPAGTRVSIDRFTGARAYLAVRGGIGVEPVLGSRSTNLEGGFGGFAGRALQAGDDLPVGPAEGDLPGGEVWRCPRPPTLIRPLTVRLLAGSASGAWSREALEWLGRTVFSVSPQSSHLGLRLTGEPLGEPGEAVGASQPMPVGAVQVTPVGLPLVLLRSRGTVGGYPVPATAVSADIRLLGQARPGEAVRFRVVSRQEAMEAASAAARQKEAMQPMRIALRPRIE